MSEFDSQAITIISGLPRSGTSMMMKMLAAGGVPVMTDEIRTADEDNPKGYFELEKVKELAKDNAWLEDAKGKSVKIISALLKHLPAKYTYNVIFIRRKIEEVLASQKQMLIRRGEPTDTVSDQKMAEIFQRHVKDVENWLAEQPNIRLLFVDYNQILESPAEGIKTINDFLGGNLNTEEMTAIVDKALYRQRR
jgi:hypothetical protein